jgi:hypothetical protein
VALIPFVGEVLGELLRPCSLFFLLVMTAWGLSRRRRSTVTATATVTVTVEGRVSPAAFALGCPAPFCFFALLCAFVLFFSSILCVCWCFRSVVVCVCVCVDVC